MYVILAMLEMQRSVQLKDVSSCLYVGGYVITVTVSLVLYYVTSFMDPGYVPIVSQVLLLLYFLVAILIFKVWLRLDLAGFAYQIHTEQGPDLEENLVCITPSNYSKHQQAETSFLFLSAAAHANYLSNLEILPEILPGPDLVG